MTELFHSLGKHFNFTYKQASLDNVLDWELLADLKERACSVKEEDFNSQLFEFFVRRPGIPTLSYQVKMYEERFIVPLAYFQPEYLINQASSKDLNWSGVAYSDLQYIHEENVANTTGESVAPAADPNIDHFPNAFCKICDYKEMTTLREFVVHLKTKHKGEHSCESCKREEFDEIGFLTHFINHFISGNKFVCNFLKFKSTECCSKKIVPKDAEGNDIKKDFVENIKSNSRLALDVAIFQSIIKASTQQQVVTATETTGIETKNEKETHVNLEKAKKFLASLLLTGSSHAFPGFDDFLKER